MQQTLLVLLGVIVLGLYSFSQQQRSADDERASIRRELETAALGVAEDWAARARRLDFDEAMVDDATIRLESDVSGLTIAGLFGLDAGDGCLADDLDDLQAFVDTMRYPVRFGEADFRVVLEIGYAELVTSPDTLLVPSPDPTNTKTARITARYLEPVGGALFFDQDPVEVRTDLVLTNTALTVRRQMRGASPIDLCAL